MSSYLRRARKLVHDAPDPTFEHLLEHGAELFAREPPTPEGEADAAAGIDESPDDVEPDEDEDRPFARRCNGRRKEASVGPKQLDEDEHHL